MGLVVFVVFVVGVGVSDAVVVVWTDAAVKGTGWVVVEVDLVAPFWSMSVWRAAGGVDAELCVEWTNPTPYRG